jgi:hypothetical protein
MEEVFAEEAAHARCHRRRVNDLAALVSGGEERSPTDAPLALTRLLLDSAATLDRDTVDTDMLARAFTLQVTGGSVPSHVGPKVCRVKKYHNIGNLYSYHRGGYRLDKPKGLHRRANSRLQRDMVGAFCFPGRRSATFRGFPGFSPCGNFVGGSQRRQGRFSFFFFLEVDHPHHAVAQESYHRDPLHQGAPFRLFREISIEKQK